MKFTTIFVALAFIFVQFGVMAAPAIITRGDVEPITSEKRQLLKAIGSIGCNAARLQTVTNLGAASLAVQKLSSTAASDVAASSAASTAASGLDQAKSAIAVIAGQLLTGQVPSAEARNQTLAGLTTAKNALAGITSSDSAVTGAVSDAAAKVDDTIAAGEQVVAQC